MESRASWHGRLARASPGNPHTGGTPVPLPRKERAEKVGPSPRRPAATERERGESGFGHAGGVRGIRLNWPPLPSPSPLREEREKTPSGHVAVVKMRPTRQRSATFS